MDVQANPTALRLSLTAGAQPWCNETAYPVEAVRWGGREWARLDAATELFGKDEVKEFLTAEVVNAQRSVDTASRRYLASCIVSPPPSRAPPLCLPPRPL